MEKKHREKIRNTGKTQGKHREFDLGWSVATLNCHTCPETIESEVNRDTQWMSLYLTDMLTISMVRSMCVIGHRK